MKEYMNLALRTNAPVDGAIERLQDPDIVNMLHCAMGMSSEANELLDMLKKTIFYGRPFDKINAKEEIGDSLWYCALGISVLKTTFEEVMSRNIEKLRLRYPEKFTSEKALNRDLDKEREILEK